MSAKNYQSVAEAWMSHVVNVTTEKGPLQEEDYRNRKDSYLCGAIASVGTLAIRLTEAVENNGGELTGADIMGIFNAQLDEAGEYLAENRKRA